MPSKKERSRRQSDASSQVLVQALASWPAPPEPVDDALLAVADLEWLGRAATYHSVEPALYVYLRDAFRGRQTVVERLHRGHVGQVIRHTQIVADLQLVAAALNSAGVRWVVAKGPILAERYWGRPDLRRYVDLDIVVDRRQLSAVLDIMDGLGARLLDVNWSMIYRDMRGELDLAMPSGVRVDLHWDILNDTTIRHSFAVQTDEMLSRRRTVMVGPVAVPTWDACDTLLHTALHCAESGAHKLVWLKDIQLILADPDLDWEAVTHRVSNGRALLALAAMVERTEHTFGEQPIPAEARRVLRRAGLWLIVTRACDRLRPPSRLPSAGLSGRAVFECIRSSTGATMREFVINARSVIRARRNAVVAGPNPLHVPDGDDSARAAYLEAVATGTCP